MTTLSGKGLVLTPGTLLSNLVEDSSENSYEKRKTSKTRKESNDCGCCGRWSCGLVALSIALSLASVSSWILGITGCNEQNGDTCSPFNNWKITAALVWGVLGSMFLVYRCLAHFALQGDEADFARWTFGAFTLFCTSVVLSLIGLLVTGYPPDNITLMQYIISCLHLATLVSNAWLLPWGLNSGEIVCDKKAIAWFCAYVFVLVSISSWIIGIAGCNDQYTSILDPNQRVIGTNAFCTPWLGWKLIASFVFSFFGLALFLVMDLIPNLRKPRAWGCIALILVGLMFTALGLAAVGLYGTHANFTAGPFIMAILSCLHISTLRTYRFSSCDHVCY